MSDISDETKAEESIGVASFCSEDSSSQLSCTSSDLEKLLNTVMYTLFNCLSVLLILDARFGF